MDRGIVPISSYPVEDLGGGRVVMIPIEDLSPINSGRRATVKKQTEKAYWDAMSHKYDSHTQKSARAYEQLVELMKEELSGDAAVLDIGTGTGEIPLQISGHVRLVEAIDYSPEMISVAQEKARKRGIKNVSFGVQDSYRLQYDDRMFDAVILANTLHVVKSPERVLAEAHRVLCDTGKLIAPTYVHGESLRTRIISWVLRRRGHPVHNRYDSKLLRAIVDQNGFEVLHQELLENIMPVSYIAAKKREA
jgi:phosphatidylethanolamine/phosphatidyl-N-methylethanolamine N-methyltransferase